MEMDWKQRRLVSRLTVILLLLSAAVLIVLGIRYRASRPQEAQTPGEPGVTAAQTEDLSALRYSNGSATLSFVMENGAWIWADEPDFPLDQAAVTAVWTLIDTLEYQQTLTPEGDLAFYGLDTPSADVTVTSPQGAVRRLTFGKTTTDGTSRYLIENDDFSSVYIAANTLFDALKTPIYDMMRLPALPDLTEERLTRLTVRGPVPAAAEGETPQSAPELTLDARWSVLSQTAVWSKGNDNVTSSASLQALVADLKTLSIIKCVDYRPSEQAASICGFDDPPAVMTAEYTTETGAAETWTLTLGGEAPEGRYARLGDDDTIYLLPADSTDALLRLASGGLDG